MQISFGQTYIVNECKNPSREQSYIDRIACAAFAQEKKLYSENPRRYKTTEALLEEYKNADVFIKNKADGTVSVEVRKNNSSPNGPLWITNPGFIPYDAKGNEKLERHNLTLNIEGSRKEVQASVGNLGQQLDYFAQKAREYAISPETKLNKELAERNEIYMGNKIHAAELSGVFEF